MLHYTLILFNNHFPFDMFNDSTDAVSTNIQQIHEQHQEVRYFECLLKKILIKFFTFDINQELYILK